MAKKRSTKKRSTTKRDTVDTGRAKLYAKRTTRGRFKEIDEVGRSLAADQRKRAKKKTKSGHGDQGDRRPTRKKAARKSSARKTSARKRAR